MKDIQIFYSPGFERSIKKIDRKLKELIKIRESQFKHNCFDPASNTHKLHGPLKYFWSFSINNKVRIIFEFATKSKVVFINIGDHSVYK